VNHAIRRADHASERRRRMPRELTQRAKRAKMRGRPMRRIRIIVTPRATCESGLKPTPAFSASVPESGKIGVKGVGGQSDSDGASSPKGPEGSARAGESERIAKKARKRKLATTRRM